MGDQVTKAIHAIDPEQPVTDIKTLMQIRDDSLTNTKVTSLLLSSFAGLALLLAATGLFGVISFLVSQRTREIGIRIALGARSDAVLMMILNQGLRMVVIGLALGVAGALAATGAVKTLAVWRVGNRLDYVRSSVGDVVGHGGAGKLCAGEESGEGGSDGGAEGKLERVNGKLEQESKAKTKAKAKSKAKTKSKAAGKSVRPTQAKIRRRV